MAAARRRARGAATRLRQTGRRGRFVHKPRESSPPDLEETRAETVPRCESLGRDDVLGTLEFDLCKLKMGHGPKDIEKTIDMNWMGMVKGATLSLTLHNKGGWGEFDG